MDSTEQHRIVDSANTPDPAGYPEPHHAGPADPGGVTSAVLTAAPPAPDHRRFTLRRSRTDVMLGGVCGGLAGELDVDPALVRIATIALTLFTGGAVALVYLAAWILAPREAPSAV